MIQDIVCSGMSQCFQACLYFAFCILICILYFVQVYFDALNPCSEDNASIWVTSNKYVITSSYHHILSDLIITSSHHHIITSSHHHGITSSYHHIVTSSYLISTVQCFPSSLFFHKDCSVFFISYHTIVSSYNIIMSSCHHIHS